MIQLLGAIAIAVALTGAARAQPDDRIAREAAARFDAGVAWSKRNNHAAALAEFEKAYALVSQWELLFNIGVTQRTLFRYGAAIKTFERYLADGADNVLPDRRRRVEAELAELRKLVGELAITVEGAPARIEIDQLFEGTTPLRSPVLLAPGTHTVRASRADAADAKTITIVSGERLAIVLEPRATPKTGHLTVTTRPPRATIRIDDRPATLAPWSGELAAGGHRITAELAGYRTEIAEIRIDAGQDRPLAIDLVELPRAARKPWYRRPVTWIAIGVGVAAATGSVIYLAQPEDADVVLRWP